MQANLHGGHLHFDCVSGIAGDMILGAFIHLGVPCSVIRDAVRALGLSEDRLSVESIVKSGIVAINVSVRNKPDMDDPKLWQSEGSPDEGRHGGQHFHYSSIRDRVKGSGLASRVVTRSLEIFDRLAEAEAMLHGTTVDDVAFHEVGAIDSVVDVVGSAAALEWLAPESVSASPVAMGRGTLRCAHGILPVPSPAAVEILRRVDAPITDGGIDHELCTPTGAAILAATVSLWGAIPAMVPWRIGYGAGDRDLSDRPNVLRGIVGGRSQSLPVRTEVDTTIVEIEANIDDMSSELCEHIAEELFAAGAVDVWWTPITMKKGRPALCLRALCPDAGAEAVMAVVLSETTSIGLRYQRKQRRVLEREMIVVNTEFGKIIMKVSRLLGEPINAAPEYDSCRQQAQAFRVPLKQVFAAATAAWYRHRSLEKAAD